MAGSPLFDGVNLPALAFFACLGLVALFASGLVDVLVGVPARAWRSWGGLRFRRATAVASAPLRHDLAAPVARVASATRLLLDELVHVQLRVNGWHDGQQPGFLARCLGYRNDDDYRPTIALFGEVSRWLHQASALDGDDSSDTLQLRRACERVRALVLADGDLPLRVREIVGAIRELDAWFSASGSSPYRDRHHTPHVSQQATADEDDEGSARKRVLARYEAVFRNIATRYADDPAARDDLRQEIRLAVWLALPKHRGDASLATYVRRIAHYCGARFLRRQFTAECIDEPIDETPDALERLADAEVRSALRAAVSALPPKHREAIELLIAGSSYREIARVLGISESNASVRVARARQQLRRRLAPIFA
jgi:RNA polymerase sigma factor (sigma-70 family)